MPKKPTFYVDCPVIADLPKAGQPSAPSPTSEPTFQPQTPVEEVIPRLLPGEILVASAKGVLKFNLYSTRSGGTIGWLLFTNFKISFISDQKSSEEDDMAGDANHANKLIGQHDISLTNILSVHSVKDKGEKIRTLSHSDNNHSDIYGIRIHTKDFATHWFGFRFTSVEHRKKILATIGFHTRVEKEDLLFSHMYCQADNSLKEVAVTFPTNPFQGPPDWADELERCEATKDWRVSFCNEMFDYSTRLPRHFVVPMTVTDAEVKQVTSQFREDCLPTWCYSTVNGFSLLRSTIPLKSVVRKEFTNRSTATSTFYNKVGKCVSVAHKPTPVKPYNVSSYLPAVGDLQTSLEKLTAFCRSENLHDFLKRDNSSYSALEGCKWLKYISLFLKCAREVSFMLQDQTVILQEPEGADLVSVISSLVQIMVDPYCRTISGFQSLIQKEFVVMGHRFIKRLGFLSDKSKQSPIFLIFLDCVWQLLQQFPGSFEFTEFYLIALWDSAHLGLFHEFMYNDEKTRQPSAKPLKRLSTPSGNHRKQELPSVWCWSHQYGPAHIALFIDPMYQLGKIRRSQSRLVLPQWVQPSIRLWEALYYRWLSPVQIDGGGSPAQYLQQCKVMEEVKGLQKVLDMLGDQDETVTVKNGGENNGGSSHFMSGKRQGHQRSQSDGATVDRASPASLSVSFDQQLGLGNQQKQPSLYFGESFSGECSSSERMQSIFVGSAFPYAKSTRQKLDDMTLAAFYDGSMLASFASGQYEEE